MTTPEDAHVSPEERERTKQAIEKLKRDIAAKKGQPRKTGVNYDKFFGPIGLDDDGNLQPPLTPEQRRRKEEWYRKADETDRRYRERRQDAEDESRGDDE